MFYFIFFLVLNKSLEKPDVYFTKNISSSLVTLFRKLNVNLKGNVSLKVHTGESGGLYFLRPDYLQEIYSNTNGTFIESNAAYNGSRNTTERHKHLLIENGWSIQDRKTIIIDEDSKYDFEIEDTKGNNKIIKKNIVGQHLKEFENCIVITHFKGNNLAGFGGALKHLAIGFASQAGKAAIYTANKTRDWTQIMENLPKQEDFIKSMAEAASTIVQYFKDKKGKIVYINVMSNISLLCDCYGPLAPEPNISDVGILASTDPVALDKACLDLLKKKNKTRENGVNELLEQIEKKSGEKLISIAKELGIGMDGYNFIDIDENKRTDLGLILFICIIFFSVLIAGILAYCLGKKDKNSKEKNIKLVEKNDDEE